MAEDVYAVPDLTKKVRYRRERERETEDRGEREERVVDIYVSADDLGPGPGPGPGPDPDPDPDPDPGPGPSSAVQQNAAQAQHGASEEPRKKNRSRVVAVCLGLLCVIFLAVIIGLARNKNDLQSRYDNVTAERDELKRKLCELCGWKTFGRGCYYISTEKKTWEASRQWCLDNQSDLIIINSKEEQGFVNEAVNSLVNQNVWLGLTDREEEGVWKWVDGTLISTPTYWRHGEPSNSTNEHCAVYHSGEIPSMNGWNDVKCAIATGMRWMCEKVV